MTVRAGIGRGKSSVSVVVTLLIWLQVSFVLQKELSSCGAPSLTTRHRKKGEQQGGEVGVLWSLGGALRLVKAVETTA